MIKKTAHQEEDQVEAKSNLTMMMCIDESFKIYIY